MNKKHIQIFVGKESNNAYAFGGCGCGTSAAPSITSFDELLKKYMTIFDGIAHFNVYEESDKQDNDELINKLNEVLIKSGQKLIVDKSNIGFLLSQSAPIIAVDGRLISIKKYPDENQLYNAVMSNKIIPAKKGCC